MIGETLEEYTLLKIIGEGGMGKVYLSKNTNDNSYYALKILNLEYVRNENIRKRFLAEAKSMAMLNHPNIAKVFKLIDKGDLVAIVLEFVNGFTLEEYINKIGKISDNNLTSIMNQILNSLIFVHSKNLVHRDIKPSNFMIDKNGRIKLLDFGIAKNLNESSSDFTATKTHHQMGTLMYMSPEQVKSSKNVSHYSDIYSLGVLLWQLVTGKKPYDTNVYGSFEILTKIVKDPLPRLNCKWDNIIQKATQKQEQLRFENCQEFKSVLNLVNNSPIEEKIDKTNINFIANKNENPNINYIANENEIREKKSFLFYFVFAICVLILGYLLKSLPNKSSNTTISLSDQIGNQELNDYEIGETIEDDVYFSNEQNSIDEKRSIDKEMDEEFSPNTPKSIFGNGIGNAGEVSIFSGTPNSESEKDSKNDQGVNNDNSKTILKTDYEVDNSELQPITYPNFEHVKVKEPLDITLKMTINKYGQVSNAEHISLSAEKLSKKEKKLINQVIEIVKAEVRYPERKKTNDIYIYRRVTLKPN
jgi:serine/threonine protein kinase